MTFVNEKGAYHTVLTVLGTEQPEINCMLKTPILKKSENYTIQLTDFIISKHPLINPKINQPFLEIKSFLDAGAFSGIYGDARIFTIRLYQRSYTL